MSLDDARLFLRGRLSRGMSRLMNRGGPPLTCVPLSAALAASGSPLSLVPLLEGRTNVAREGAVAAWLSARGVRFARQPFATLEGRGENFVVEFGAGERVLILIAHHDAVPGSPGANDNAAAVAVLLTLLERLAAAPPANLRVRLLFTAAEEQGYLGARAYAGATGLGDVAGVLSLELCGIGDAVAVWDVTGESGFLGRVRAACDGIGLVADGDYHIVGRIPIFGSDHRAFAHQVPAYGLTVIPRREAEGLRRFVFSPVRSALVHLVRRPPPFATYHTRHDAGGTLEPGALDLVLRVLPAVIDEVARA